VSIYSLPMSLCHPMCLDCVTAANKMETSSVANKVNTTPLNRKSWSCDCLYMSWECLHNLYDSATILSPLLIKQPHDQLPACHIFLTSHF